MGNVVVVVLVDTVPGLLASSELVKLEAGDEDEVLELLLTLAVAELTAVPVVKMLELPVPVPGGGAP